MRRLLLSVPVVALVMIVGCAAPAPSSPAGTAATGWEAEMLANINTQRSAVGVGPLALCGTLNTAAQRHSIDQAAHNNMSHTGSNGSTMVTRVQAAGYNGWTSLAENVAYGYSNVGSVMNGWMNSSGHRTNLLAASTTHVGVGRAAATSGTLYWTQDFGRSGTC